MSRRANGEGTKPYLQADGRWRAEIVVGWTDNGRPRKKIIYGPTEAACSRKLRKALSERDAGVLVAGKSPTLGDWLDYWLDNIAVTRVEPSSLVAYRNKVRAYVKGTRAARTRLDRLTPEDLEQIYTAMRTRQPKPLSETTILQLHLLLSGALKVAVQRGRLGSNPAAKLDPPSAKKFAPELLTPDDARALIRAAEGMENGARWMIALGLGLRQGEALGLGWDRVDLDAGTLTVTRQLQRLPHQHGCQDIKACTAGKHHTKAGCPRHEGPCPKPCPQDCAGHASACPQKRGGGLHIKEQAKSEAGERELALPAPLVDALRGHREKQMRARKIMGSGWSMFTAANGVTVDLVFCQPTGRAIDPTTDWRTWKKFLASAGVPEVRLHDARHTAATVLLLLHVPPRVVMEMMGWSQMSMLTRYQHVLDEMKIAAASKMAGALWQPAPEPAPEPATAGVVSMDAFRKRKQA